MSKDIKNKIDEALATFYQEADKELIDDLLSEHIQDINEYNKKKRQIMFLAKAKAQKKRNEDLQTIVSKFQYAIESNIEKPIAMLKQLIQGNPSFALYRNLDKLSKEDIIEIIKDQNIIQLLDKMENNDKSH